MSSLSPAAETLRNNDVLWLCVSESDCQSQISVGCRRSGNIRNLSAVVRVCLWKGCDVFVAEKKSRTVLFPHFLPLKGEEERRRRKWGSESCLLLDWPAWLSVVWLVCDCCVSSSSEQFYNLCRLCDWLNQLSVCPVRPSDWPVECLCPLSVTGHVVGRRVAQLQDFICWFLFEFRGDTFVT